MAIVHDRLNIVGGSTFFAFHGTSSLHSLPTVAHGIYVLERANHFHTDIVVLYTVYGEYGFFVDFVGYIVFAV
jgi:hypothetical protein